MGSGLQSLPEEFAERQQLPDKVTPVTFFKVLCINGLGVPLTRYVS